MKTILSAIIFVTVMSAITSDDIINMAKRASVLKDVSVVKTSFNLKSGGDGKI